MPPTWPPQLVDRCLQFAQVMEFDTSDVVEQHHPRRRRPTTEVIPIDEEDMLEAACILPRRPAVGTLAPPVAADAVPVEITDDEA